MNAADYSGGKVVPGEIVVLYPSKAGPSTLAQYQLDRDGRVATTAGETRVWFDDIAAPIVYSTDGRIGAIVPYEVANKSRTRVSIEYHGTRSREVSLPVMATAPALFTLDGSGRGQAAMLNQTGCCNSNRNPAAQGTVVSLYATGEGETIPQGIDGNVSSFPRVADLPVPRQKVSVTVAGRPAEVMFAGEAPLAVAGLLQINVRVPQDAPVGDAIPVMIRIGNVSSAPGVTLAIKSAVRQVLIIERETNLRGQIAATLSRAGYETMTAAGVRQAESTVAQRVPDLAIYDLAIDHAELPDWADFRARHPKMKWVAMASALTPDVLKLADLQGAQAILTRPIDPEAMLKRIDKLLEEIPMPYAARDDR